MGSALLQGWLDQGISASSITIVEPNSDAARDFTDRLGVNAVGIGNTRVE